MMAYGEFYVERQGWARWPKTLIMCRKRGYETIERRRYVPERTCRNIAEPDEMSDDPFTCSECGARGPYGDGIYHIGGSREVDGKTVFWDSWPVYKFCPNCGARVIGTEAGE